MRFALPDSSDDEDGLGRILSSPEASNTSPYALRRTTNAAHMPSRSRRHRTSSGRLGIAGSPFTSDDSFDEHSNDHDDSASEAEIAKDVPSRPSNKKLGKAPMYGSQSKGKTVEFAIERKSKKAATSRSRTKVIGQLPSPISKKEKEVLVAELDEWERWELTSRQQAFLRAQEQSARFTAQLHSSSSVAEAKARQAAEEAAERDLNEVKLMLEHMEISRAEQDRRDREAFDRRNQALWSSIEATIKAVEDSKAQALVRERVAAERKKQEEEARLKEVRRKEEEKVKQEAERKVKEAEEKARTEQKKAEVAAAKAERQKQAKEKANQDSQQGIWTGLSIKAQEWSDWRDKMRTFKEQVIEKVKSDPALKKEVRANNRTIGVRVGQVINTRESICKVTNELHEVLSRYAPDGTTNPSVQYMYTLSHLSKCLIRQSENEVSAKPEAAYPLAKVVVGLLLRGHAALGEILMARLVKKCCWVVPFYPPREEGQDDAEYRKSVGQKQGSAESDVQYASRMGAILTLYFAICSVNLVSLFPTLPRQPSSPQELEALIPPALRISAAWSWLAGIVRPPLAGLDPTPQLITTALETMGQDLVDYYGAGQMQKLVRAIRMQGLGMVNVGDVAADAGSLGPKNAPARQRLALLIQPMESRVPPSFDANPAKEWEV